MLKTQSRSTLKKSTGPVDHIKAAAELDKDTFLKTLTALSAKVNLFTETFCSRRPNYLFPESIIS